MRMKLKVMSALIAMGSTALVAEEDENTIQIKNVKDGTMVDIDVNNSPIGGSLDEGTVQVVEFKAFDCPPCKALNKAMKKVRAHYVEDPRVVFVHKFMQLQSGYNQSEKGFCAAQLDEPSNAVGQTYFNKAKSILFANPRVSTSSFMSQMDLEKESNDAVMDCISDSATRTRLMREVADFRAAGLRYLPTLYVGGQQYNVDSYSASAADKIIARIESYLKDQ